MPCALITPIAPHTLSFRPVVVPEASDIDIHLSESSRGHARWARHSTCRNLCEAVAHTILGGSASRMPLLLLCRASCGYQALHED